MKVVELLATFAITTTQRQQALFWWCPGMVLVWWDGGVFGGGGGGGGGYITFRGGQPSVNVSSSALGRQLLVDDRTIVMMTFLTRQKPNIAERQCPRNSRPGMRDDGM